MCLAVPMRVVLIEGNEVEVDLAGVRQRARADLLDEVAVGDHVLVHAGFALTRLDPEEAEATLALFAELEQANADQHHG